MSGGAAGPGRPTDSAGSAPSGLGCYIACLEGLPDGIGIVDLRSGKQVYVNPAFARMVDLDRQQLLGRPPFPYWPPAHRATIREALAESLTGTARPFRLTFQRPGGDLFPASIVPSRVEIDGHPYLVATVKDLSEVEERTRKLERTEARLEVLLEGGDVAVWEWDVADGSFWVSDSYYTQLDYEPGAWEASYESWARRVHPDDIGAADAAMHALLSGASPAYRSEYRVRDAAGEWRWILARGHVTTRDAEGTPATVTGTHLDIHRYKRQEAKLRQFQQLELVGQLAAGIAHDFNNVLGTISGNLQLLEVVDDPDERRTCLEEMDVATRRASSLTRSLLSYAREETREVEAVDVGAALSRAHRLMASSLPADIDLDMEEDDGTYVVEVDPAGLENAVLNLVVNARDAYPPGASGVIRVSWGRQRVPKGPAGSQRATGGDYLTIRVQDRGRGMDRDELERATEPLFTTKPLGQGSGLGLSVVRRFCRESGGALRLDSKEGVGTTAEILLPLRPDPSSGPDEAEERRRDLPGGEESILIVDDEEGILRVLSTQLGRLGYRTHTARDPRTALARLDEHAIDLLLTDIVMPFTLDGPGLARRARALHPELPVIFVSGYADADQLESVQSVGPLLRKPFEMSDLAQLVRRTLDEATS